MVDVVYAPAFFAEQFGSRRALKVAHAIAIFAHRPRALAGLRVPWFFIRALFFGAAALAGTTVQYAWL